MKKKRKILIVSGSRGEYGYIRPILKIIKASKNLESEVIATNMHLLPDFGNSIKEFYSDNIPVNYKVYMALSGYTNTSMLKSLGIFMMSIADLLTNNRPDIILIAGDRGEQLVAAMAGAHVNIPVAHIQAGEISGNVDGLSRHAITRFSHIHFAANKDAEQRLIRSGEEPFRVYCVGAPQLDELVNGKVKMSEDIAGRFSIDLRKPMILVVQHPVTEQAAMAYDQMKATMKAVINTGLQTVILYPNNDAGSAAIQESILNNRTINIKVERNISREVFAGLMSVASVIIGNSSSGIIEAPLFELPAVNIGRRQEGRLSGKNVISVKEHDPVSIESALKKALSKEFRDSLKGMESPYGDGHSSERIVKILEDITIDEKLLFKKMTF